MQGLCSISVYSHIYSRILNHLSFYDVFSDPWPCPATILLSQGGVRSAVDGWISVLAEVKLGGYFIRVATLSSKIWLEPFEDISNACFRKTYLHWLCKSDIQRWLLFGNICTNMSERCGRKWVSRHNMPEGHWTI